MLLLALSWLSCCIVIVIFISGYSEVTVSHFHFREASRVVLVPFPPVSNDHSEENRFEYQQQLEKSMKWASRSVGSLIVIGDAD